MSDKAKTKAKAIAIFGCTGVGKTDLSLRIAKEINSEIINADSIQIYKQFNIGSAKATPQERKIVPHHLIDIVEPTQHFDTYMYFKSAISKIKELNEKGIAPLIVGGTGLYFKVLFNGIFEGPSKDEKLRTEFKEKADKNGLDTLYNELEQIDPDYASKISSNDERRIIRALEVFSLTGKPLSVLHKETPKPDIDYLKIGLTISRAELYERINKRCEIMLENGLITEVEQLIKSGLSLENPSMHGIGYKQVYCYLKGEYDYNEMVRLFKRDTRRFAKRQIILFKREENVHWFSPEDEEAILSLVNSFNFNVL